MPLSAKFHVGDVLVVELPTPVETPSILIESRRHTLLKLHTGRAGAVAQWENTSLRSTKALCLSLSTLRMLHIHKQPGHCCLRALSFETPEAAVNH